LFFLKTGTDFYNPAPKCLCLTLKAIFVPEKTKIGLLYQTVFKSWRSACVFLTTKHTNRTKKKSWKQSVLKADWDYTSESQNLGRTSVTDISAIFRRKKYKKIDFS